MKRMERIEERREAKRHLEAWMEMLKSAQEQLRSHNHKRPRWEVNGWVEVCAERVDYYYAVLGCESPRGDL